MQAAIIWFDRKLFHGKKKASLRSEIVTSINNWCAIRIIEQISGPLYSVSGPGSSVVIPTALPGPQPERVLVKIIQRNESCS